MLATPEDRTRYQCLILGRGPVPLIFLDQNRGAEIFIFTQRSKPSGGEQQADYHGHHKNAHYWCFVLFLLRYINGPGQISHDTSFCTEFKPINVSLCEQIITKFASKIVSSFFHLHSLLSPLSSFFSLSRFWLNLLGAKNLNNCYKVGMFHC